LEAEANFEEVLQDFDPSLMEEAAAEADIRLPQQQSIEAGEALRVPILNEPRIPAEPSDEDRRKHELLGHTTYEQWCKFCVASKGTERPHRRKEPSDTPIVTMDYFFLTSHGFLGSDDPGSITVLSGFDTQTSSPFACQCSAKGKRDAYAIATMSKWIESLGHKRIILRCDKENHIQMVAMDIRKQCSTDIVVQGVPEDSHASMGSGEAVHRWLAGQFRAVKQSLEEKWKAKITMSDMTIPWIIKYVPWIRHRHHT
jgi:hypothetical protein